MWPDGTLLKYSDWCGIEPNGFPALGEKHVVFTEVGWYDVPSSSSYPSLCEKGQRKFHTLLLVAGAPVPKRLQVSER